MKISDNGLNLIKQFEGFSAQAYTCPAGKRTIGYGHVILTGEKFPPEGISKIAAEDTLKIDVSKAQKAVLRLVRVPLTQHQFDALVSFVYNIGGKAFRESTMLSLLRENKMDLAAAEFDKWVYAGGKMLKGLANRRFEESEMFRLPLPPAIHPYS